MLKYVVSFFIGQIAKTISGLSGLSGLSGMVGSGGSESFTGDVIHARWYGAWLDTYWTIGGPDNPPESITELKFFGG